MIELIHQLSGLMTTPKAYQVIDKRTYKPIGKPVMTLGKAIQKIDRLDLKHGSYIHGYELVNI